MRQRPTGETRWGACLWSVTGGGRPPHRGSAPQGSGGVLFPDGTHLAHEPSFQWEPAWKGYRGGQTTTIWIADLATSAIVKIPQADNSNNKNLLWVGNTIYFLSDLSGSVALYDLDTKAVTAAAPNDGVDFTSASAGPGGASRNSSAGSTSSTPPPARPCPSRPHPHRRRGRARPGVVAGRRADRLLLRRLGGLRAAPHEPGRAR